MTIPALPVRTTGLTLPQELLLLSLRDSGLLRKDSAMGFVLTGGALVELVLAERIRIDADGTVHVTDPTPTRDDACDLLLGELTASPKERNCRAWLRRLKRRLLDPTGAALSRAELVSDANIRWLDVIWLRRYRPLEDPAAEQLRSRLRLVLAGGAAGDDRTLMLGLLLDAGGLLGSVVPELSFLHRRERMKEVLAQVWEGDAVKHAVVAVRKAIQEQQASGAAAASG